MIEQKSFNQEAIEVADMLAVIERKIEEMRYRFKESQTEYHVGILDGKNEEGLQAALAVLTRMQSYQDQLSEVERTMRDLRHASSDLTRVRWDGYIK